MIRYEEDDIEILELEEAYEKECIEKASHSNNQSNDTYLDVLLNTLEISEAESILEIYKNSTLSMNDKLLLINEIEDNTDDSISIMEDYGDRILRKILRQYFDRSTVKRIMSGNFENEKPKLKKLAKTILWQQRNEIQKYITDTIKTV